MSKDKLFIITFTQEMCNDKLYSYCIATGDSIDDEDVLDKVADNFNLIVEEASTDLDSITNIEIHEIANSKDFSRVKVTARFRNEMNEDREKRLAANIEKELRKEMYEKLKKEFEND